MKIKKLLYSTMLLGTFATATLPSVHAFAEDATVDSIVSEASNLDRSSISSLNASITKLQTAISDLEAKNNELKTEVDKQNEEVEALAKNVIARTKQLNKQAADMQTTSKGTWLDAVTSSGSLSDILSKLSAMGTVSSANNDAITDLKKQKAELEKKQKENQDKINEINSNSQKLETTKADLEVAKQDLLHKQGYNNEEELLAAEQRAKEARTGANGIQDRSNEAIQAGEGNFTPNYAANSYPVGQCTWGCKVLLPWVGDYWGNANQWGASAQAAGHTISYTPKVGSVIVWPNEGGGYGHVAVVSKVIDANTIEVLEANYGGSAYAADPRGVGNYRGPFNWPSSGGGGAYFIYE